MLYCETPTTLALSDAFLPTDDGNKLFRDFGVLSNNLVELTGLARQADTNFNETFGADRTLVSLAHVSTSSQCNVNCLALFHAAVLPPSANEETQ
jgi:hypothetical protein